MAFQFGRIQDLTVDEIMGRIEHDLPGWDYLFRSNFRRDNTSDLPYFANIMTPDFQGAVIYVPGGYIDTSLGQRFIGYGETKAIALAKSYSAAMECFHADEDA